MTLIGLLLMIIIAMIVGTLGQSIAGYTLGGCIVSAVVGFIGAFLGRWLAGQLGLPEPFPLIVEGETFPLLWSVVGSALFVAVIGLLSRRRRVV